MNDPRRAEELLARAEELPAGERDEFLRREADGDEELLSLLRGALDEDDPAASYFTSLEEQVSREVAARLEQLPERAPAAVQAADLFDDGDLPRRLGAYRLLRELGRGGMGVVYLAEREASSGGGSGPVLPAGGPRRVAVKVLHGGSAGAEVRRRFLAERRILGSLDHPGIARLLDVGVGTDGSSYLVVELVEGEPLLDYCDKHRLGIDERLALFEQVCSAVEYAHGHLVVHRDLKPGNILVGHGTGGGAASASSAGTPRVKLVDFGIAKILSGAPLHEDGATLPLTRTGVRLMTPEYAAPEQIAGGEVTVATDVFSLGVVLYELLVGVRPFDESRGPLGIERAVLESEPARPSTRLRERTVTIAGGISVEELAGRRRLRPQRLRRRLQGDLDVICLTALRKEPARRYASVARLREDLARHRNGLPVSARPDTVGYRARKFVKRHRIGVAMTAGVIALLFLGVLLLLRQNSVTQRERDKAERVAALLVDVFGGADPSEARAAEQSARELLERGAQRVLGDRSSLDDQPAVRAALLDVLGAVHGNLGDYGRAVELLEQALALRRGEAAGDQTELVHTLLRLGELRRHRGELQLSEPLLREALEVALLEFGESSAEVAEARDSLGKLHVDQGRLDEAVAMLEQAVAARRRLFGADSAAVADSLNNLAAAMLQQGRLDEAQPVFEEALRIRRERLGADHPLVPATLNNLASVLDQRGDRAGAERAYREALAIYRRIHGAQHPRIATTLNNLGLARLHQGDLDGAESFLREAVSMRRALLTSDHPDLAQGLANLGYVVQGRGATTEAEALYREALDIRRRALDAGDPRIAQSLNNLGLLLVGRGGTENLREAEAVLREALAQVRATLGDRHPLVATGHNNLGLVLLRQGRAEEARVEYAVALALRREILPAGHSHTAYALLGLGQSLAALGGRPNLREAETLLREALAIREKTLPPGHRLIGEVADALRACEAALAAEG